MRGRHCRNLSEANQLQSSEMVDSTNRIIIYPTVFHITSASPWKSGGLGRYQGMSGDQLHQYCVNIYECISPSFLWPLFSSHQSPFFSFGLPRTWLNSCAQTSLGPRMRSLGGKDCLGLLSAVSSPWIQISRPPTTRFRCLRCNLVCSHQSNRLAS